MKTTVIKIGNRKSEIGNFKAFTIVELLVVISIIAILAAMLLPALSRAKITAQKTQARLQISDIVTAIQQYDSAYSRFPVTNAAQNAASSMTPPGDFTYGAVFQTPTAPCSLLNTTYAMSNCEVIAILMDITNTTVTSVNMNHQKNPQRTPFLNAKMVTDITLPGVGPDLVYRDPWGNPYIISMDLNYDEQCNDAFYSLKNVSQASGQTGWNGLINPDTGGNSDNFRYHGKVMVWSAGPDGKINPNAAANAGVNVDNVLSWQ